MSDLLAGPAERALDEASSKLADAVCFLRIKKRERVKLDKRMTAFDEDGVHCQHASRVGFARQTGASVVPEAKPRITVSFETFGGSHAQQPQRLPYERSAE